MIEGYYIFYQPYKKFRGITRMNKRNTIYKAAVFILVLLFIGTSVPLSRNTMASVSSSITDNPTIDLTVEKPLFTFGSAQTDSGSFATIDISGQEGYTTMIGDAKLPVIRYMIEIPQGAQPSVTVTSVSWDATSLQQLGLPSRVLPVQPSVVKLPGASAAFTIHPAFYSANAFTPSEVARITTIGEIRGHRVALIEVTPVQYNPVSGELKLMTACTLQVSLPGSDMARTQETFQRYSTPSFTSLYRAAFKNYGTFENGVPTRDQEGYLIIVYDQFYNAILPLADWKTAQGFDTTVTKTSEIPGGPTKENIKAYITDAYNSWPIPPAFVLLVGDVAQIPTWTGTDTGTCTDLYYVTITPGDYFADIFIGRFPAADETQVATMVDKTVYYEQGNFPSNDWIKKAAFMASNDNYQVSEGTHNYVIDTFLNPHNYTCNKLYCHTYGATTQQVKDALNNGRSLAIYSGHGSETYWADGPVFYQSDVNSLTNDGMYPVVCSHACLTCQFTVSECFGETWLRAPHKAGVIFWGASDLSYWDEDDILERSMFAAWWNDNIEFICGMTNMGLYTLYQYYGGGGISRYYFEEYNLLGDPSLKVWNDDPITNLPPATPNAPSGPSTGVTFITYTFSDTVPADPEGQRVYLLWDWGNNETSQWLGPYNAGQQASAIICVGSARRVWCACQGYG